LANSSQQTAILFVCLGNICRSPLAEGVFRQAVKDAGLEENYLLDSAGTGSWHVGNLPDPHSIAVTQNHNIDLTDQRCRQLRADDFDRFDLIICMDRSNVSNVLRQKPAGSRAEIEMFMPYALGRDEEIPDPYGEGPEGFEHVYQMILEASVALLKKTG